MELEEHMMKEEMRHGCLLFNSTKEPFDQMQLKILFSRIAHMNFPTTDLAVVKLVAYIQMHMIFTCASQKKLEDP
jgi:hypothetical protein